MLKRIVKAVKALLGLDTLGLKEAEGIYENARGKFSPEETRAINFGVMQTAAALGHKVVIQEQAKSEREAMLTVAQTANEEAETFVEKTAQKEAELLRKAAALRKEAEEMEASAAAVAEASQTRIKTIEEVEKAFTF